MYRAIGLKKQPKLISYIFLFKTIWVVKNKSVSYHLVMIDNIFVFKILQFSSTLSLPVCFYLLNAYVCKFRIVVKANFIA
jgi:hypothetical protein